MGVWYRKRAITRDNYNDYELEVVKEETQKSLFVQGPLCPIFSAWHSKYFFTKHLLFPSPVNCLSSFWSPRPIPFLAQDGNKLQLPECQGEFHCLCGAPVCTKLNFSPVNLSYVSLINRTAKGT